MKNYNKYLLGFLMMIGLALPSCKDEPSPEITFINACDEVIYFRPVISKLNGVELNVDFIFNKLGSQYLIKLHPGESCTTYYDYESDYDDKSDSDPDTYNYNWIQIIYFKEQTLTSNSEKDIVEKNIYDGYLKFTFGDLKRLNYIVSFN